MPSKIETELETSRLLLRRWRPSDVEPFARLNADPIVMEHFPAGETFEQTTAMVERIQKFFAERGYGLYAAELKGTSEFIGFIGLSSPRWESHFTPCVEIGWRIAKEHWGKGYAPEGARRVLKFAFNSLALPEIVSMTATTNLKSMRVMEKIGMKRNPADDFDHPMLPDGHHLQRHVLYRIKNDSYQ